MQLTVDSAEPLADVLRVIGALYGVTLNTSGRGDADQADGEGSTARSSSRRSPRSGARTRRSTTTRSAAADAKTIREWANQNGFDVSTRGALPASVREAHLAAHPT